MVSVVVLFLLAGLVSAMAGHLEMIQDSAQLLVPMLLIGLLLAMVGLFAYKLPEGYSKEAVWAWKTGPFR